MGDPPRLERVEPAVDLGPLALDPAVEALLLRPGALLVDHEDRRLHHAVAGRLERQRLPEPRLLRIEPPAGEVVEIAADHPAVVERRPVLALEHRDLAERVAGDRHRPRRHRRPARGHHLDAGQEPGLVQHHGDLAHEGRSRRTVEPHHATRRRRTRPRPEASTSIAALRQPEHAAEPRAAVHRPLRLGVVGMPAQALGQAVEHALVGNVLRVRRMARGIEGHRRDRAETERGPGQGREGEDGQGRSSIAARSRHASRRSPLT